MFLYYFYIYYIVIILFLYIFYTFISHFVPILIIISYMIHMNHIWFIHSLSSAQISRSSVAFLLLYDLTQYNSVFQYSLTSRLITYSILLLFLLRVFPLANNLLRSFTRVRPVFDLFAFCIHSAQIHTHTQVNIYTIYMYICIDRYLYLCPWQTIVALGARVLAMGRPINSLRQLDIFFFFFCFGVTFIISSQCWE